MTEVSLSNSIINHLEFLGFEIEKLESENGFWFIARNDSRSNLLFRIQSSNVLFTARYSGFDKNTTKDLRFHEITNNLNRQGMMKWFFDDDDDDLVIVIESFCYGYDKKVFGEILTQLENEIQNHIKDYEQYYSGS